MGRPRSARYVINGTLRATAPLHVGSGSSAPGLDRSLILDGEGRPFIPGTALTGVLREALADDLMSRAAHDSKACERLTTRLFGDASENGASAVIVDDAKIDGTIQIDVRDGVAIDRRSGAAAPGLLYNREVLAAGSAFTLHVTVDEQPDATSSSDQAAQDAEVDSDARWLAKAIASRLASGIRVGAEVTRGLGSVIGEELAISSVEAVDTRHGMLRLLRGESDPLDWPASDVAPPPAFGMTVEVAWRPASPVMVGVASEGSADRIPATAPEVGADPRLVIYGSSIKGAIRARAEYILRTLLSTAAPEDAVRSLGSVLDDTADERMPEVLSLFGRPKPSRAASGVPAPVGGRAALRVADCLSTQTLDSGTWAEVRMALDSAQPPQGLPRNATREQRREHEKRQRRAERDALRSRLDMVGNTGVRFLLSDHVAIDRWTGGASDSRLFCVAEPHAVTWEPLRLTLDLRRTRGEDDQERALVLLLLALRDLRDGWIPLGSATRRGLGQVQVTGVDIRVGKEFHDSWAALAGLFDEQHPAHSAAVSEVERAMTRWRDYINRRRTQLSEVG